MNMREAKAYAGTLKITTLTSADADIGIGNVNLSTITGQDLIANLFKTASVVRSTPNQGAFATYAISITTSSVLMDSAEFRLKLPKTQITPQSNLACQKTSDNADLSCTLNASLDANYAQAKFAEYLCIGADCPKDTIFNFTLFNTKNALVNSNSSY
jgi:hypothetical protein